MDLQRLARILVALDFSELSLSAVRTALSFSAPEKIHLVHVLPVMGGLNWMTGKADEEARTEVVTERIHRELATAKIPSDGMTLHVVVGAPGPEICDLANHLNAELVVIGSHGHKGGLQRLLMGSTAYAVVRHVKTSVLVVR